MGRGFSSGACYSNRSTMSQLFAIATTDGVSVCDHLARSAAFLVFEIEDGKVVSRTVRSRDAEQCGNHRTFMDLASGCRAVICAGVGQGAVTALAAHGVETIVLAAPMTVEAAAEGFLAGTLKTTDARVCLCG
jgi:predicted Fe-Mo cluster-binding NifX family protein